MAIAERTAGTVSIPVVNVRPGWAGWLSTTDHKRIGIMYLVSAFVFFLIGGIGTAHAHPTRRAG